MSTDIRPILRFLATADAAAIAKMAACMTPAAGSTARFDGHTYIYISKIGYVLNGKLILAHGGVIVKLGEYVGTFAAQEAVYGPNEIRFRNDLNEYIVRFAPHGPHLQIDTTEIIPHKPATAAPYDEYSLNTVKNYIDNVLVKMVRTEGPSVVTRMYSDGAERIREIVTGCRSELIDVSTGERTVSVRLHPDVHRRKPDYHLKTPEGVVVFRDGSAYRDGQPTPGSLKIAGTIYKFSVDGCTRKFRVVPGEGKAYTLEEIK